jgi:hypothetical protein
MEKGMIDLASTGGIMKLLRMLDSKNPQEVFKWER